MTEAEWLSGDDLQRMLGHIGRKATDRKLRSFITHACVEWRLHEFVHDYTADETGRFPDDVAGWVDTGRFEDLGPMSHEFLSFIDQIYRTGWPTFGAYYRLQARAVASEAHGRAEREPLAAALRCLFGNPFRPVRFSPAWRTSTAVALAGTIYDGRSFDILPILADALEDAGCEDPEVLAHCRGDGIHTRGCWVVDRVLGRE